MVNKFKDFLGKIRAKIPSRKKPNAAEHDRTGDVDISELEAEEIPSTPLMDQPVERSDVSAPNLKLQKINRLTPYTYKIKSAIKPLLEKSKVALKQLFTKSGISKKIQQTDWAAFTEKIIAKENLTHHHRFFLASFLLVATYSSGKIAALLLRGRPEFPPVVSQISVEEIDDFKASDLNQVKASDPFKTKTNTGPKLQSDARCEVADSRTSLPIKLVNAVVLQDSVKSIAAVQVRSSRDLKQVREGDTIDGMAKISRIARLEMIIKNLETGACESVSNDKMRDTRSPINIMSSAEANNFKQQQKIKGIENQGNKYIIAKDLLDEKLKDISSVLTQARAIKIQNPDGTLAFKITEIEAGGIFSYLGIQNEDIITSINGKPISDLNEVMGLFGRIKNLDQLQLGVRRDGEESQMDYQMKK
ncbi:MAG: PDZ domain-containing protein [Bacteriovoracaceae bacterium]|nr:PDZ domain-containing protein [Bacteriovoracaceae bacterium]